MTRIVLVIILIVVGTCVLAEPIDNEPFDAETRLVELEVEAGRWRSLCILLGFTTGAGVLFMLFTLFGNPPTIAG